MVGNASRSRLRSVYFNPYSTTRLTRAGWPVCSGSPAVGLVPGFTLRRMMLVAPSCLIWAIACVFDPSPIASMAMTEPTPRMTPSNASPLRSLRRRRFFRAFATARDQ